MRSVLISIKPRWCELIASGRKIVEVRKTAPKLEPPFKCYIYCTKEKPFLVWGDVFRGNWETEITHLTGYSREAAEKIWDIFNGMMLGEFVCTRVEEFTANATTAHLVNTERIAHSAHIPMDDLLKYGRKSPCLYGWHISKLVIYDEPKPIAQFGIENAPQSWCYVKEDA